LRSRRGSWPSNRRPPASRWLRPRKPPLPDRPIGASTRRPPALARRSPWRARRYCS
jgi:hypothetical protein